VLTQVAPAMAAYYIDTATSNDELIAGPSGAGYIYPSRWPGEHLPFFLRRTGKLMQAMDLRTLEVLDMRWWQTSGLRVLSILKLLGMAFRGTKRQECFVEALKPYGLEGIVSGAGGVLPRWKKVDDVPIYHNLGLVGSVNVALWLIKFASLLCRRRPLFLNVYIVAWSMTPSDVRKVVEQLGDAYEVVLPKTLLAYLAQTR